MKVKKLLFFALFASVYCAQSFCMELKNFDTEQVHTLLVAMRQTPDSFNALAQSLAHQMYLQNPTITCSALRAFFCDGEKIKNPILPKEIINKIWQFIVDERFRCTVDPIGYLTKLVFVNGLTRPTAVDQFSGSWYSRHDFGSCDNQLRILQVSRDQCWDAETLDKLAPQKTDFDNAKATGHSCLKRIWLLHGSSCAIIIIFNEKSIFIVPNISYVHKVTTGVQLLENIYQAYNHCRQFTNWEQAREMLESLNISNY